MVKCIYPQVEAHSEWGSGTTRTMTYTKLPHQKWESTLEYRQRGLLQTFQNSVVIGRDEFVWSRTTLKLEEGEVCDPAIPPLGTPSNFLVDTCNTVTRVRLVVSHKVGGCKVCSQTTHFAQFVLHTISDSHVVLRRCSPPMAVLQLSLPQTTTCGDVRLSCTPRKKFAE